MPKRLPSLLLAAFLLAGPGSASGAPLKGLVPLPSPPVPQAEDELPGIREKTRGMQRLDGFIPLYWDARSGKLWMEIGSFDEELLHYASTAAGLGSNDVGVDRGRLAGRWVVEFRRVGPRVLMVEPNYQYRADSDNALERKAVRDAFAESVLWGFTVAAETDGRVLVDATEYVLADRAGVEDRLRESGAGSYKVDAKRSALHLERTRAFPDNTEIEVTLTFAGDRPGRWVGSVTPTAEAVTLRQHLSFVRLPELGSYAPRTFHPGSGYGAETYRDYAAPLGESMERRFIRRHRLEKKDPTAARSEPVEPIVYYLDPGTPEPVRSALLEGARWWNQAFEAAGFIDAFRVEMLPEDADPMDVRYNVIQWVHRSTRGWSYGASVDDPRTGEILKGHVSLGSLRVRQDWLIAEGLLSPYARGDEAPAEVEAMALARIRQLSAHEVGHTLGLSHNYISSAQGRASVMDYPHPLIRLGEDGELDLSDAYDEGIGEWDKVSIVYGYQPVPQGQTEAEFLEGILREARDRGLTFITDQDARPQGSAHPRVHLWDNGADAAEELDRVMAVRRVALDRFGPAAIRSGMPLAMLEEALVPLYLHHRYQVEAAVKGVGGLEYTYALRGDGQIPLSPLPDAVQRAALSAVLATLSPGELALPREILGQLPPRPSGYPPHRELFPRHTGLVFDAVAPALVASDLTVGLLLHPERAARLVQQSSLRPGTLGLRETLHELFAATFQAETGSAYEAEIARATQGVVIQHLMRLSAGAPMAQVRAEATHALEVLAGELGGYEAAGPEGAHFAYWSREIRRFLDRPMESSPTPTTPDAPPGSPIGEPALLMDLPGWSGAWIEGVLGPACSRGEDRS